VLLEEIEAALEERAKFREGLRHRWGAYEEAPPETGA
jgi:hypothetical protein